MKTIAKWASLALFALYLTACASGPRTTTEAERFQALEVLNVAEAAITAAHVAGKIDAMKHALAMSQVAELRELVSQSEDVPVSWSSLLLRVTALGAAWAAK